MATDNAGRRTGLLIGMLLLAANLRPAITGVGPLIDAITAGTRLPAVLAGLVTAVPLIAFGLFSPLAPMLARRMGLERVLYTGLILLLIGTLIRSLPSAPLLLIGMFFVGTGIAVANVLLPSLVKRDFPSRIGFVTGLYVTVMNVFAGLASGVSVPLAGDFHLGWQGALAVWSMLTVLALIWWLPFLRARHTVEVAPREPLWRSWLAWQLTFFMGLQSFLFYVSIAWLPSLLHSRGFSLSTAGWLVSIMQLVGLPATFVVPILAGRQHRQPALVIGVSLTFFLGFLGLLTTHTLWTTVLCMVLLGLGMGASISLALAFFALRTRHHHTAGAVSGMAQSIGYFLAAVGPFTVGYMYHLSHAWNGPLVLLIAVVLIMTVFGLGAARNRYIEDDVGALMRG
ncbi:MAG: MFS transporter [Firmicutes bacterium]|nr:MFS transporter [Bacillota bacterium]